MKVKISESAVGQRGRTGRKDAETFVKNNPELIDQFKKIVSKIGGKAVAAEILNLNLFGKPKDQPKVKYTLTKQPGVK